MKFIKPKEERKVCRWTESPDNLLESLEFIGVEGRIRPCYDCDSLTIGLMLKKDQRISGTKIFSAVWYVHIEDLIVPAW